MTELEIEEISVPTLGRPSYMVVGYPDAGLVGVITTEFLIRSLNMRPFASLVSKGGFPIAYVSNSVAASPFQFYHAQNVVIFHSWVALQSNMVGPVSSKIVDYAQKLGIDEIISITGVPVPNRLDLEKLNMYYIASDEEVAKNLSAFEELKPFGDGYIVGPYAPLLLLSKSRGVRNVVFVVDSFLDIPDPEASATVLQFLSKYIGLTIDVSELHKEAEEIRSRIRGLMEQTKQELRNYMSGRGPMTYT
ncbi:MAG: PAC2 family protein [Sulfolobales archaeon]|nr:PAC2 family protein [Sulfolobales archaeon]MCG2893574.1 PAC2 family protein [Sulfolobales archaeon]MCG2910030.1 PAC2 family protein [Sulfolobales archaeon]